jgi:hypothetical protein
MKNVRSITALANLLRTKHLALAKAISWLSLPAFTEEKSETAGGGSVGA